MRTAFADYGRSRISVSDPGRRLRGVVVCSAAGLHPGDVIAERVQLADGLIGLRQAVVPHRARECLVMSLLPEGHDDAEDWAAVLDARGSWLPWALAHAELPDLEAILRT